MEIINEWIKFEYQTPKLNEEVEIKFGNGEIEKGKAVMLLKNIYFHYENNSDIKEWRHIPEKIPDFEKLDIGDLIIIKNKADKLCSGILAEITRSYIRISIWGGEVNSGYIPFDSIRNIKRINMEDNTFEEI